MYKTAEYDVALSFAGEDREYVEKVASNLKEKGVKVFYDKYDEANLWGKNMYDYFSNIYGEKAFFTIMFISKYYKDKLWSNHERQWAQSRALEENREYILPARFDATEIPGVLPTISYISLQDRSIEDSCDLIIQKLISFGRTVPSQEIRKASVEQTSKAKSNHSVFVVTVKNVTGEPVVDADIYLIAENNTFLFGHTDIKGVATFEIKTLRRCRLYIAHHNYPAYCDNIIDFASDVTIAIPSADGRGSIVCNSTGYIPGLKGRLNPILDAQNRTYLYADNIAINGGEIQPVSFRVQVPFILEDCDGVIMQVVVKEIRGRVSLIEFNSTQI